MIYNELVETCFFSPKHVGTIDLAEPLSTYYRGGDSRGDFFDLYLLCSKEGLVIKARFKAYGNPYLLAGAEWLCQYLEGSLITEQGFMNASLLAQQLAIPKSHYSVALQIEDSYRETRKMMTTKLGNRSAN